MKLKNLIICLLAIFIGTNINAQVADKNLVQFSGMILDGSTSELIPVPYTNVLVREKGRGTYSDFTGFFSIVVEKGDVIEFSAVGYKTVEYQIPVDLEDSRYSLVQLMTQDTMNLPETVVFPWPSKEHFKLEFLAMDVTSEMEERALRNVANETLQRMRSTVPSDGREHANYYLRQQARSYYYIGQQPPMNIFNPIAWKQFFDAWKSESASDSKHEYHNGYIYAMAGGTLNHGLICGNIYGEIRAGLKENHSDCKAINSEVKLYIQSLNSFLYPDTKVICGGIEQSNKEVNAVTNPSIIVEVLSKTTAHYDRGDKFYFYRQIPSLQE